MKTTLIATLLAAFAQSATCAAEPASAVAQSATPNIVVILADDVGYGDLSCYGATKIKTPNLDRLAGQGMRFTDAHAPSSVCTPTRYGLLTGRYCWRTKLHPEKRGSTLNPDEPLLIDTQRMTLASLLKGRGYRTAAIGKWHLGYGNAPKVDWNRPLSPGPLELGFDYHFGVPQNHGDVVRAYVENHDLLGRRPGENFRLVSGKHFAMPEGLEKPRVDDQVDTTLTAKAIHFLEENQQRPFFLYFTPVATHNFVVPAAPFRGTSPAGIYGDYMQELDHHVGQIMETLDRLKLADRTLVIFTSDNGSYAGTVKPPKGVELKLADDSDEVRKDFLSARYIALKKGHLTNGSLRSGKGSPYEGGSREPFIARWPGQVPPGTVARETICLTDLLATTAGIVKAKLPANAGEDSYDILPILTGKKLNGPIRPATVVQDSSGNFTLRSEQWKLIIPRKAGKVELFDLTADLAEKKNLAAKHPDLVKSLTAKLTQIIADGRSTPGTPQKNDEPVSIH
jgi:arylsulfatase A-like enzyme